MTVIDTYLQKVEPDKRKALERIRKIAKKAVPDADETISYGMPTLTHKGKAFLGFDAHKNHLGIYPYGGEEIEVFKEEIKNLGYKYSVGAIQVPYASEFPENLLVKIIQHRIKRFKN